MVKGKVKSSTLEKDDILSKITTYDIYRFYQGPFNINEVCINYHRGETNPSLIISSRLSVNLKHKDFGDKNWSGDCFNFVQQIFSCDFPTALRIIDRDFGLGFTDGKVKKDRKVITWEQPEIEEKRPPLFQVIYYSTMPKKALDYWDKFGVGADMLKKENIYYPAEIWRNRKKIPMGNLLTFAYHYPDIDSWKIYRPFAPRRQDDTPINQWKWDSNVPFDYIDNMKAITGECPAVYLAKSKKDRLVLQNALQTDCIADVQAEDAGCLSFDNLEKFKQVDRRYIISDNDKKGKEFSWWLTKEHGFKHINVPDNYLIDLPKCTDFADLCYYHGMDIVTNHFKSKGIIL
jgi:hypothetical protein